jgi:hypothetical protein
MLNLRKRGKNENVLKEIIGKWKSWRYVVFAFCWMLVALYPLFHQYSHSDIISALKIWKLKYSD